MRRGAKPAKAKGDAKLPLARKSRKNEGSSNRQLEKRLEKALKREAEALEQQTATAEILQVISRSPTDIQPVFDAIATSALRLCEAVYSFVFRFDGRLIHLAAHHGVAPEGLAAVQATFPIAPGQGSTTARAISTGTIVHIPNASADPEYTYPVLVRAGFLTVLSVPMLRDGKPIGAITVSRGEVRPFSDRQIALLETFADQAAIAVENARLFQELQARNRELSEALEQQTATSEILRVISSSPTDLPPVMDTVAENAARVCGANDATILRVEGDALHVVAHYGSVPTSRRIGERIPITLGTMYGRTVADRQTIHADMAEAVETDFPDLKERQRLTGIRTFLSTPLLREGVPIGVIAIRRTEVRPFSDKQIALLKTFADQAVIAIENVRLFKELEARNRDLTEALEQQTATSEILRVISSSRTDVQPVFDTIAERAVKLCNAEIGVVSTIDGEYLQLAAMYGLTSERAEVTRRAFPMPLDAESTSARAVRSRAVAHFADAIADPDYQYKDTAQTGRWRATLAVPMLRGGQVIGAIFVARAAPGVYPDSQIELLQTFADQAVIAIENVRLFKALEGRTTELARSVEELKALGEVSQAVSSTLDVETVLRTVVSRASQLAGADGGSIHEYDELAQEFPMRATHNYEAELAVALQATPLRRGEGVMGRAAERREPVQVADIAGEGAYQSRFRDVLLRMGYRALLTVPLVREEQLIGTLAVARKVPGEFAPDVVELLKTFATQSALAIQNARLFREIADKSRQLEAASRHKSEFLANMSHELRTPLNAIIGFSEVLAERMFGEVNEKQAEYLQDILGSGRHLLSLINDILDLSKVEAGHLELEVASFNLPVAVDNALTLVRERATRHGITLDQAVDARVGDIVADERKVKQILLNLLSNAVKFTPAGGRVAVTATPSEGGIEISVRDTGIGIAPEDQAAIFEEFRQVGRNDARTQEGTGLGLTLAKKFVELHGGQIWVRSQVGQGSTFTFTLPVRPHDSPTDQEGGAPH